MIAVSIGLIVLAAVVLGAVAVVRRVMDKGEATGDIGGDVLVYVLLALAVGVSAFALAALAATAFGGEDFVVDVTGRVARSLAALVVAAPVALFLWRRQARRRGAHPESSGWTLYLSVMEAVFMTALVSSLIALLDWALSDGDPSEWTDIAIFGGVVVFHQWAWRATPPRSKASGSPRVIGSAIGLVATVTGLGGILIWVLGEIYATLAPTAGGSDLGLWVSFLLAGAPVWYYRWIRPWPDDPGAPRTIWTVLVAIVGLAAVLGSIAVIVTQTLAFLLTDTGPAGPHFDFLPASLTVVIVGWAAWLHHRDRLGPERTDAVRAYQYAMSALGLVATVSGATGLASAAFGPGDLVRDRGETLIAVIVVLVVGAALWLWFWTRVSALPRDAEAASRPRRVYLVGLSVVLGLVSAGALITALVILFQRLLGSGDSESVTVPVSLFVFAGVATWHLLRNNAADRELIGSDESLSPFNVTIVCSDPGTLTGSLPPMARVRVIRRADEVGVVDAEMAAQIVEAVGHRSSLVWVDGDGYRVAPIH